MGTRSSRHNQGRKRLAPRDLAKLDARKMEAVRLRSERRASGMEIIANICQSDDVPSHVSEAVYDAIRALPLSRAEIAARQAAGRAKATAERATNPQPEPKPIIVSSMVKRGESYESVCSHHWSYSRYDSAEDAFIREYWEKGAHPEWMADVLARPFNHITNRAHDLRLILPAWARKKRPNKIRVLADRTPLLTFPYIIKNTRPEHETILAINALVPRGIPEHMRADICQEALLAVLEGKTTIETLSQHDNISRFVKNFYKTNYDANTISLEGGRDGDDERPFDEIATASVYAHFADRGDQANNIWPTHVPAHQEHDWYRREIETKRAKMIAEGEFVSPEEAEEQFEPWRFHGHRHMKAPLNLLNRLPPPEPPDPYRNYWAPSTATPEGAPKYIRWINDSRATRGRHGAR